MAFQHHFILTTGMFALLIGSGAGFAQPAPSTSPPPAAFHERVEDVARALQNNPRFKNLPEEQRRDRVEFVIGNTLFALLHEIGHAAIGEMKLPVLGREEDEADSYAALRMLRFVGSSFSQRALAEVAKNWFLNARRDQETGATPVYYGEHTLGQQRAYQVVCLMVGSDPAKFKSLADEFQMPPERQETCRKDYGKVSRSWDAVLGPHRRAPDQPQTKIYVVYSEAPENLAGFARAFQRVQLLETVAQRSASDLAWPVPFTLEMRSCGSPESAWSEENRTVRVCYELAFDFVQLYDAYVAAAGAPTANNQKPKQSNGSQLQKKTPSKEKF
jgi:hypothetical protein